MASLARADRRNLLPNSRLQSLASSMAAWAFASVLTTLTPAALAGPDPAGSTLTQKTTVRLPASNTDAELSATIARLDSPDLLTRYEAHRDLFQNAAISLDDLVRAMGRDGLSAEQRVRLEDIAESRFRRSDKGALGVSFMESPTSERIVIDAPLTNWDSARVLRPGDVLVSLDGRLIAGRDDVRIAVLSHDPGDEVALVFERDGMIMRSMVRLGRFADLEDQRNTLNLDVLRTAWEARLERVLGNTRATDTVVRTGVRRSDIARSERTLMAAQLAAAAQPPESLDTAAQAAGPNGIAMVPAGEEPEPRAFAAAGLGGAITSESYQSLDPARNTPNRRFGNGGVRIQRPGQAGNAANPGEVANLVRFLEMQRSQREAVIKDLEARANDPTLNRVQRDGIRDLMDANRERMREIDMQLRALRGVDAQPAAPKVP